jgi:hypothetical protein
MMVSRDIETPESDIERVLRTLVTSPEDRRTGPQAWVCDTIHTHYSMNYVTQVFVRDCYGSTVREACRALLRVWQWGGPEASCDLG